MASDASLETVEAVASRPAYLSITVEMLDGLDLECVINEATAADCREYQDLFSKAAERAAEEGNVDFATVYGALSALSGFHFRPNDVNDPYGPMMQMGDRRSAVPEDFRAVADVIAKIAEMANDVTLKARLCDVAWLLNRRRADLGLLAISAYCQIVRDIAVGAKKFQFEKSNSPYSAQTRDLLKRALSLASMRSVGLGKPQETEVRQLLERLFRDALAGINLRDLQRVSKLALQYEVVPTADIGDFITEWLKSNDTNDDHDRLDILKISASAYHRSGRMSDYYRCRVEAVDTLVRMSERAEGNSAMMAAGHLSDAISELHGIPNVKERRRELRHRLVDVQTNIAEELQTFSHELDLSEIISEREALIDGLALRDLLFGFADMAHSPDPQELREEAIKNIGDNPLSSIFSSSFHDRDGKVSYRSPGVSLTSAPTDESLRASIAQSEGVRRQIFAASDIQTVRRLINERYLVTEETFAALLKYSGFVPEELLQTYSLGFRRFFQGDPVSSLYILTPLLEASIRHVLKGRGHDVSTFDNATKTQQDLTISAMVDQMETELVDVFGSSIVTDIKSVFLSQPGPTIRHEVAHGLLSDRTPYGPDCAYACWLIFRLCLIPLFPHRERFDEELWQ